MDFRADHAGFDARHAKQTEDALPFVLLHGGGGSSRDYVETPDGRPGWLALLADRGLRGVALDRPGFGESPWTAELGPRTPAPAIDFLRAVFAPELVEASPPHGQWPIIDGDANATLESLLARSTGVAEDLPRYQAVERQRLIDAVTTIGPCVVVAHSAGGAAGVHLADALPDLVRVLVLIEPSSPPFSDFMGPGNLAWGLTAAPIEYEPAADHPSQIALIPQPARGGFPAGALQAEPARRLKNVSAVPTIVVTSEHSGAVHLDPQTVDFLRQAGVRVQHLRLNEVGVHGNGHGMMLELNNEEVLDTILEHVENARRGGI